MMTDDEFAAVQAPDGSTRPRRTGLRAALFILVPLLIVAVLAVAVAYKQRAFVAHDELFVFTDSATGITVGMQVKIQGFMVGKVKEIALVPGETSGTSRVRVLFEVNREYMALVDKDAQVGLTREGLIGQPIFEIRPSGGSARRAGHHDVLKFDRGRSVSDIAEDLSGKIMPLLDDTRDMVRQFKDPQGDLAATLKEARNAVGDAGAAARSVQRLAHQAETTVAGAGSEATRALASTDRLIRRVEGEMPKVGRLLDDATATTASVRQTVKQAEGHVTGLAAEGEHLTREVTGIVDGAKRTWPLKLWVPPDPPETLRIDSQGEASSYIVPPGRNTGK